MYSIEDIKENYRGLSDAKIENIALNQSKSLRKEILEVLKDEILRRNLNTNLINWVDTETKFFEGIERDSLINKIQKLDCPKCQVKTDKLYGFQINQIISVLIYTNDTRQDKILCRPCGKSAKWTALLATFFFGWWSRKGIFLTPYVLVRDTINFFFIDKISDTIFNQFVDQNSGQIRRNGIENATLNRLIIRLNNKEKVSGDGFDFF